MIFQCIFFVRSPLREHVLIPQSCSSFPLVIVSAPFTLCPLLFLCSSFHDRSLFFLAHIILFTAPDDLLSSEVHNAWDVLSAYCSDLEEWMEEHLQQPEQQQEATKQNKNVNTKAITGSSSSSAASEPSSSILSTWRISEMMCCNMMPKL